MLDETIDEDVDEGDEVEERSLGLSLVSSHFHRLAVVWLELFPFPVGGATVVVVTMG